ncbi:MAG TPA: DUF488 family protein [Bacteroidota bacterium]
MAIKLKRIYDEPSRTDGVRILVDRLWPRGLTKEDAAIDEWIRDIAPSGNLRKWFGHKVERWPEFQRRYKKELKQAQNKQILQKLARISGIATVTLLYAAKDSDRNNAVVLAAVLKSSRK